MNLREGSAGAKRSIREKNKSNQACSPGGKRKLRAGGYILFLGESFLSRPVLLRPVLFLYVVSHESSVSN